MGAIRNPKHELFAQRVATGESATTAYRAIYGAGKNADVFGPRLMGNDGIRARVAALQASAAKACVLTLERKRELLAGFANNCDAKMADRIAAVMADAKLAGELTEKAEIKDTTPREPLEVVRARIAAAEATHGRS